jgi:hypothetical protein
MTTPTITCPACGRRSAHPDDIANRYCGNCQAFHAELPQRSEPGASKWDSATFPARWRMASIVSDLITPALVALDLQAILPGDPIPARVRELLFEGRDLSLKRGTMFYDVDCEPIDKPIAKTLEYIDDIRTNRGGELDAFLRSDAGVPVQVRTTFLGIDLSTGGALPLIWETLVIVGDDLSIGVLEPIRYATQPAAYAGNSAVVSTVLETLREAEC